MQSGEKVEAKWLDGSRLEQVQRSVSAMKVMEDRVSPAAAVASWPVGGMDEIAEAAPPPLFFSIDWPTVAGLYNPHCKLLIASTILCKRRQQSRLFAICSSTSPHSRLTCFPPALHVNTIILKMCIVENWVWWLYMFDYLVYSCGKFLNQYLVNKTQIKQQQKNKQTKNLSYHPGLLKIFNVPS